MLSVVCFKWTQANYGRFNADMVNVLQRMVARHYPPPHKFFCVTDDPTGIDPSVEIVPLWNDFADVPSPHGPGKPSCYRRLKMFAPDIGQVFGDRFVCIDLDTVITGDLTPVFDRPEDFICWGETNPKSWYNGSLFMLTAGARPQVWQRFDPKSSPRLAQRAGKFGSDQGWLSYCLGKGEATWGRGDGIYSYRVHLAPYGGGLPKDARMVMFHGRIDPDSPRAQALPWVRHFYQ